MALQRQKFTQTYLEDYLMTAHVELRARPKWFMEDGASPHYTFSVRQWAHEYFAISYIVRRGQVK
jgi:hypothetical protein